MGSPVMRLEIDTSFGNLEKPPVLLRVTKNVQQNRRQNPGERREGAPLVKICSGGKLGGFQTFAAARHEL